MSNISLIYDAIDAALATALPSHGEIINPYQPETDSNLTLDRAYSFAVLDGSNLLGNPNSGVDQIERSFQVIITRRKFGTKADIAERKSTEKELLEDVQKVIQEIKESKSLQQTGVSLEARYSSDPGFEFLRAEQNRNDIFAIRLSISVQYTETYTLIS
jgi:hypothetical protein